MIMNRIAVPRADPTDEDVEVRSTASLALRGGLPDEKCEYHSPNEDERSVKDDVPQVIPQPP